MAYASQISLPSWNISQSLPKKLGGSKSVKYVSLLCVHSKQIKYLEIVDQSFNYNHTVVLWNLTSLFLPKIIANYGARNNQGLLSQELYDGFFQLFVINVFIQKLKGMNDPVYEPRSTGVQATIAFGQWLESFP